MIRQDISSRCRTAPQRQGAAPIAPIAHGVRGHRPRDERRHGHDSRKSRRRRSRGVRGGGRRLPRVSRLEQSPTPGRRGGCPGGRRAEGGLPHQARSVHVQRRVRADGRGPHALRRPAQRAGREAGRRARPLATGQRRRLRLQRRRRGRVGRRRRRTRVRQVQPHATGRARVPAHPGAADGHGRVRGHTRYQRGGSP